MNIKNDKVQNDIIWFLAGSSLKMKDIRMILTKLLNYVKEKKCQHQQ